MEETVQPKEQPSSEALKPNAKYSCFLDAHSFAKSLSLKSRKEWRAWAKGEMPEKNVRPIQVPAHPDGIYKVKGWQGWKHWLGTADKGLYDGNKSN
jgi:hypothetical protein